MNAQVSALIRRLQICGTAGTEIIEFAVSLPLLVVLAVAIYDFGSAFTFKHKLTSAVREGARVASSLRHPPNPTVNGGCGAPTNICAVRDVIANNLQSSAGDDCGLGSASAAYSGPGTFTWTFTGGCTGLSLKVERASLNSATLANPFDSADPYKIENSKVTLVYPYQWKFAKAFQFFGGSASYLGSTITVTSTMQNLD